MYIYDLPLKVNKELCRLLDIDDQWKELAGRYMEYSAFEVIVSEDEMLRREFPRKEIEQTANRRKISPTAHLFTCWGQLNHRVEELFILLYRMGHIPALEGLVPLLDDKFHRLLKKQKNTCLIDENDNNQDDKTQSSIPEPVKIIEQLPSYSKVSEQSQTNSPSESNTDNETENSSQVADAKKDEFLRSVASIPMVRYEELRLATNNWSESNLLGQGGFGQVYKGEWKYLLVAIKKLIRDDDGNHKELINEMCLNQYRHDNILPLYAYSLGGPEACLVYQLMLGGSLQQRLLAADIRAPLQPRHRYNIALGVARGLSFLHTMLESPLIHGDIKPANILLDQCLMPKIGDFGLARKGPFGDIKSYTKVSKVHGTRPYLPVDYIQTLHLSPAVDVYSFGVVTLQLVTALPPKNIITIVQAVKDPVILEDPLLRGTPQSNPDWCREFISIGLHCTRRLGDERPAMSEVYTRICSMKLTWKEE